VSDHILVAGIGNIFLGDDGFGPEVVRRLRDGAAELATADDVRIHDYGIAGMHLAYDLLDDWAALVLVDAVPDTGRPGELRVFEADLDTLGAGGALDAHGMDPGAVFAGVRALGGIPPRTVVVGCQVADTSDGIALSSPVADAVPAAVAAVRDLVARVRAEIVSAAGAVTLQEG
jgi:hydrogenase maturation protease